MRVTAACPSFQLLLDEFIYLGKEIFTYHWTEFCPTSIGGNMLLNELTAFTKMLVMPVRVTALASMALSIWLAPKNPAKAADFYQNPNGGQIQVVYDPNPFLPLDHIHGWVTDPNSLNWFLFSYGGGPDNFLAINVGREVPPGITNSSVAEPGFLLYSQGGEREGGWTNSGPIFGSNPPWGAIVGPPYQPDSNGSTTIYYQLQPGKYYLGIDGLGTSYSQAFVGNYEVSFLGGALFDPPGQTFDSPVSSVPEPSELAGTALSGALSLRWLRRKAIRTAKMGS